MNNNYQKNMFAFKTAWDNGEFDELPPGTWVAFVNQKLVATATTGTEILEHESVINADAPYIDRVNDSEIDQD